MMIWRDIERSSRLRVLQPDFNPSKRSLLPCPFFLDMLSLPSVRQNRLASTSAPTLGDAYLFIEDADALFAE